jgi:aryl-alcohol dehydrogenase-like predicted oxidoreductase
VLGTVALSSEAPGESFELLDAWIGAGGNVVDTAARYRDGDSEAVLGRWLEHHPGGRERLVVVSKGAHPPVPDYRPPRVNPGAIASDLRESTERLGGPPDLYLLHRDDPSVPVGPLIEALNEHMAAGGFRAFGASNWTTGRIEEANAYAAARGLEGFCCSSPHLSLATWSEPPWPDTVSAADAASRAWYARTGIPVFAWSAQARGFFVNPSAEARAYGTAENLERHARAAELGRRTGRTANDVALAWVLHQPFPTFAVIGPQSVAELESSLGALEVELTPGEVRRLAR